MQASCPLCGACAATGLNMRADELERALRELTKHVSSVNFINCSARAEHVASMEETIRRQEDLLKDQALRLREQKLILERQADALERQAQEIREHRHASGAAIRSLVSMVSSHK